MATLNTWSLPTTLSPPLSGRDAVADAVYRALLGFDTNHLDIFKSAFNEDSTFTVNDKVTEGLDKIVSELFGMVSKLDTTHHLTNMRINIDGAKATLSATVLAQHYRGGTGTDPKAERYLAGGLYLLDLVKGNGDVEVWKIASWKIQIIWGEGDATVLR